MDGVPLVPPSGHPQTSVPRGYLCTAAAARDDLRELYLLPGPPPTAASPPPLARSLCLHHPPAKLAYIGRKCRVVDVSERRLHSNPQQEVFSLSGLTPDCRIGVND